MLFVPAALLPLLYVVLMFKNVPGRFSEKFINRALTALVVAELVLFLTVAATQSWLVLAAHLGCIGLAILFTRKLHRTHQQMLEMFESFKPTSTQSLEKFFRLIARTYPDRYVNVRWLEDETHHVFLDNNFLGDIRSDPTEPGSLLNRLWDSHPAVFRHTLQGELQLTYVQRGECIHLTRYSPE